MWNRNVDRNISVLEGKSEAEKSSVDTGTLSTIDRESKKIPENTNCGPDSGYLSGPLSAYISEEIDEISPQKDNNTDSDLIEDNNDNSSASDTTATNPNNTNTKENINDSQMILDSGIDCNLNEWFSHLKFSDESTPLNNLSCDRKNNEKQNTSARKDGSNRPRIWEICYRQNDEGDT